MLQRTTISPMPTSAEMAESINASQAAAWVAGFRQAVALPTSAQGFLIFMLGLILICTGVIVQVFLSAQVRQLDVAIATKQAEIELIEQANAEIIWSISQESNLSVMEARAKSLGFQPIAQPIYLMRPAINLETIQPFAEDTQTGGSQSTVSTMTARSTPEQVLTPIGAARQSVNTPDAWQGTSSLVSNLRAAIAGQFQASGQR